MISLNQYLKQNEEALSIRSVHHMVLIAVIHYVCFASTLAIMVHWHNNEVYKEGQEVLMDALGVLNKQDMS